MRKGEKEREGQRERERERKREGQIKRANERERMREKEKERERERERERKGKEGFIKSTNTTAVQGYLAQKKALTLGPYSKPMPRALWWSYCGFW